VVLTSLSSYETEVLQACAVISCSGCDRTAKETPLTWTYESGSHPQRLCESCTRDRVALIEARLDDWLFSAAR
jgi:hypothetical protein